MHECALNLTILMKALHLLHIQKKDVFLYIDCNANFTGLVQLPDKIAGRSSHNLTCSLCNMTVVLEMLTK